MNDINGLKALGSLAPGAAGTLSAFDGDSETIDRLREIGFDEGLEVELLHQSPIGKDPIAVRVGNMTIALRRKEANLIKVQVA